MTRFDPSRGPVVSGDHFPPKRRQSYFGRKSEHRSANRPFLSKSLLDNKFWLLPARFSYERMNAPEQFTVPGDANMIAAFNLYFMHGDGHAYNPSSQFREVRCHSAKLGA